MQPEELVAQREMVRAAINRIPNEMTRMLIRIGALQNGINNQVNHICEKYDLTTAQTKVLFFLHYQQKCSVDHEITARDLEQFCGVSNPTMAGILKRLELKDYITRVKSKSDARNKQIKLKKNIDPMLEDYENRLNTMAGKLFKEISDVDRIQMENFLDSLLKNLDEFDAYKV